MATALPTCCSSVLGSYCSRTVLLLLAGPTERARSGKSFAARPQDDQHVPMGTAADQQAGSGTPIPVPPAAQGVRLAWEQVPERLRHRVERHVGSRVVSARTQS